MILLLEVVLYCVVCMLLELSVYECICTCPHGELSLICQRLYSKRWGKGGGGGGEREREGQLFVTLHAYQYVGGAHDVLPHPLSFS